MNDIKFNANIKVSIIAAVLTGMLFLFLFFYLGINQRQFAYDDSRKWAQEVSRKAAVETELYLTPALTAARSMAEKAVFLRSYGGKREEIKKILLTSLNQNSNFLCAWTQMEANAYDNLDNYYKGDSTYDVNGSMSLGYFRYKGITIFERNNVDDFLNDYYTVPKARQKEMIVEPYYYVYHGHTYKFYETSAVVPIMDGNVFLGVFAIDIDLNQLQKNLNTIRPYNDGFLALITSNGTIVSHIDSTIIHKNFYDFIRSGSLPKYQPLKDGKELTIETVSEFSKMPVFRFFYPIFVGKGSDPWYVMIEIPVDAASTRSNQLIYVALGTLILGLLLLLYLVLNILDRKRSDKIISNAIKEVEQQSVIATTNARNYQEIFNSTNEAIFIHDAITGDILEVNEVVLKMFGYSSKEEVFNCTIADISSNIAPFSTNEAKEYLTIALKMGSCVFDWLSKRKNGEVFWTEVSLSSSEIGGYGRVLAVVRDISSRINAEKALSKSQQLFQSLAGMAPVGIFRASLEGKLTYVNAKWTEITGLSYDEALGDGWLNAVYPDDRPLLQYGWAEILKNPDNSVAEYRYIKANGDIVFALATVKVEVVDGENVGFIGTVTDISDIKRAQVQVAKSEKKFRDLSELLPQPVWEADLLGNFTYANKQALELFQFTDEDLLLGLNFSETLVPEQRAIAANDARNIINGELSPGIEYVGLKKDQTTFPMKIFSTVIVESDKVIGIRGVSFDLTEIKKAEQELRASEERYRSIIEAFPDIIMLSDLSGNIIFANDVLERITGITPNDYSNPNRTAKIHPDDFSLVANAIKELLTTTISHTAIIENRFVDIWGKTHWFSGVVSKLIVNDEVILQTISRDITEKKYIETELEQYRFRLELLVKDRTEELEVANEELIVTNEELFSQRERLELSLLNLQKAHEQLVQVEKMASLGVLAAGVAHEINNPLNYINGGALGIKSYFEDYLADHLPDVLPLIDAIDMGVERAADIVRSLNRFSRQTDSMNEKCDLHAVINNCLLILLNQFKNRIEIAKDFTDKSFTLLGNEGKLHQAILNVISNSIHSISAEGVITILTSIDNDRVNLTIMDSGCGIDKEHISKIFDPFFTTKEPGRGTGLGLSITYQIIQEFSGTINYSSKVGDGTTAIISLPILLNQTL